jgi:hypothetical protein
MKLHTAKTVKNAALIAGIAVLPLAVIYALGNVAGRESTDPEIFEEQYPDPHMGI